MSISPSSTKPTLAIIDGFSFLFRAFYGVRSLNRSDGMPTNALYGFSQMLLKVIKDINPHCCAVALEGKGKNFRKDIYPEYKANRSETPEDLMPQIPLLEPLIQAFNIPAIHVDTFEADDVIATVVDRYAVTHDVIIISSDKDLMQLIRPGVTMLDTMKNKTIDAASVQEKFGVPPSGVIDVQALIGDASDNVPGVPSVGPKTAEKLMAEFGDFEGIFANLGAIKRDKLRATLTENEELARVSRRLVTLVHDVPLVLDSEALRFAPDVEKAKEFLRHTLEFDTLANRLGNGEAHFSKEAMAREKYVPEGGETAENSEKTSNKPEYNTHPFSRYSTAPEISQKHRTLEGQKGLKGNTGDSAEEKLPNNPQKWNENALKGTIPQNNTQKPIYECVTSEKSLQKWMKRIKTAKRVCLDTETTHITAAQAELVGISLSVAAGEACYIPLTHKGGDENAFDFGEAQGAPEQLSTVDVLTALKPILADKTILKIAHHMKYDWQILAKAYEITPQEPAFYTFIQNVDDTLLMSFVLNGGKHNHGLDFLANKLLGIAPIPFKEVCGVGKKQITFDYVLLPEATQYAGEDADLTLQLHALFTAELNTPEMADIKALYRDVESPLVPVLAQMEAQGVLVDKGALSKLSHSLYERLAALEKEIHALSGSTFNINSPKQLGEILFDHMGISPPKKNRSTNADVLEKLASQGHSIADKVLAYRHLAKLKSTYADALADKITARTGRIHTHYHQMGAATGRFSSSDPNLQNIPVRTEDGRQIREAFIPQAGWEMASLDYSQIELRLLAHFSESAPLMEAFKAGVDVHTRTAELLFGDAGATDTEKSDRRRMAKIINFGLIYGMGPVNLAKQMGVPRAEATAFIERYFERYTGVREYMNRNKEFALTHGYVTTLMHRRVHLENITSSNPMFKAGAERAAINAPLQGSNADIIKKVMPQIADYLRAEGAKTRMLMQVHDELVFEVPKDEKDTIIPHIQRLMEQVVTLKVPLKVDVGFGGNWAVAH